MSEFVSNPLFGIALSILAYLVGMLIYRRFPHPLTTPLLLSAIFIIIFLKATGISYQDYYHLSKGDGYFLPRLLPRWGLSEQLDCPIDRGSRDSAL